MNLEKYLLQITVYIDYRMWYDYFMIYKIGGGNYKMLCIRQLVVRKRPKNRMI